MREGRGNRGGGDHISPLCEFRLYIMYVCMYKIYIYDMEVKAAIFGRRLVRGQERTVGEKIYGRHV